ncbi:pentatricopeptide repeat-containing protein [Citrus sinensis]|uniref:Pentatricopeptide repeat-containing protein n=1 Tax=Citrus sinensis TaxID=2711 RepID=A0ACB8HS26_CITSI|nr:pentatricopeptide repeat-containing protein [Citrus sinensis]KAH9677537.1 pentatricopeptide repeat-containing protein [Citrus sinensis]
MNVLSINEVNVFVFVRMLSLSYSLPPFTKIFEPIKISRNARSLVVCAARGPRPRYPRVWKARKRIGTISKSAKLVTCIKGLSNVKEEVYGALDSFIAWELEFPLITVKKALKTLENEKDWKRIIQIFADMEELGVRPNVSIVSMMGNAFQKLGMLDKYEKLKKKYPPPKWEYRYIKGKRVRIPAKPKYELDSATEGKTNEVETTKNPNESSEEPEAAANLNESLEETEANTKELLEEADAISNESDISSTSNVPG